MGFAVVGAAVGVASRVGRGVGAGETLGMGVCGSDGAGEAVGTAEEYVGAGLEVLLEVGAGEIVG